MHDESGLPGATNLPYVEGLYEAYLHDPETVPAEWADYFRRADEDGAGGGMHSKSLGPSFAPRSIFDPVPPTAAATAQSSQAAFLQDRVDQLMRAYRVRGHRAAEVNPLGPPKEIPTELDPAFYGFTDADMEKTFSADTIPGPGQLKLREIVDHLRTTYCRSIGVQFMHIDSLTVRSWLMQRMEATQNRCRLDREEQVRIFTALADAVLFEEFIQKKFIGAKSFSLEGAETLIPLLGEAVEKSSELGIDEVVIGMAHRGRLNVLANILGKSPARIFHEFEDNDPSRFMGRGDVKYHLGYRGNWAASSTGKSVGLELCFNPSHLEFVNPVAVGQTRALQDVRFGRNRHKAMAILIHGDAAFIGEGVVQETLNLSEIDSTATGGTLHVVVNNQIGFTTPAEEGRSSIYATDIAKMLQVPIFHVNGEDPEAVAQTVRLALDFREEFQRDVVIDMYCYRRRGHNETDEPSFTQPLMYKTIRARKKVSEAYMEHLQAIGEISPEVAKSIMSLRRTRLEQQLDKMREGDLDMAAGRTNPDRKAYNGGPVAKAKKIQTGLPKERLAELLEAQTKLPESFNLHRKLERLLKQRREMARGQKPLDWGAAEALAFASLVTEGTRIRITGQDVGRGTFSHRHAVLHDSETGEKHVPIANLSDDQGTFDIYNSALSEAGCLGFEYGFSLAARKALTIWEAQFGDFVNTAQVIIDQFLSSAEDKWDQLSPLVMLLPHSFEGQGPEHSSARLERFLALAAEDNMQVVYPTTPAQIFHLLRRQVRREWYKPLVVMSPKSLLRLPAATSSLEELANGRFQTVIPDTAVNSDGVERILLCTGKVYYDLLAERERREIQDVPIIRLEEIYPHDDEALAAALEPYPEDASVVWVQEEPANMGAWTFLRVRWLERIHGRAFQGVSRSESASPATGSHSAHQEEQRQLMEQAFTVPLASRTRVTS